MDYKHKVAYKPSVPHTSLSQHEAGLDTGSGVGGAVGGVRLEGVQRFDSCKMEWGWPGHGVPQPESMVKSWMSRGFQYRATAELYTRDHT